MSFPFFEQRLLTFSNLVHCTGWFFTRYIYINSLVSRNQIISRNSFKFKFLEFKSSEALRLAAVSPKTAKEK